MKILVVEDDPVIAQTLRILLSSYSYAVDVAADGETGWEMAEAYEYDLIVLDVILPRLDGISLCQQIRTAGYKTPILLLTGQAGGTQKAIALNAGADDYVVKPFDAEELVARVQALLRRGKATSQPILTWGQLSIDPSTRKVAYGNHILSITPKEYAILELLLRNPQNILSSKTIVERAWTSLEFPGEEAVRVHIKRVRQKLMAIGAPKDLIKTKHRVGYQLNPLYASSDLTKMADQFTAPQIAEINTVNEELRATLEQMRSTLAAVQQQNQELAIANQTLEQEKQQLARQLAEHPSEQQMSHDRDSNRYHLLDAEGRIIQINEIGLAMLGYSRESAMTERNCREANLAFLAEVSQDLTHLTNIDDTINQLGAKIGAYFNASVCAFSEIDEQQQFATVLYEWKREDLPSWKGRHRIDDFHTEDFCQACCRGETYIVHDTARDPRTNAAQMAAFSVGAFVDVPLVRMGRWQFSLTIADTAPREWRTDEIQLISELANRIWFRLESARAEAELTQSETKYRSLFESIDQGFCLIELLFDANDKAIDYRFIEINEAFEQQSGLVNSVGKTILELVPNFEPQWAELYGQVAKSGEAVRFEAAVPSMNRIFDVYAFPIGAPGQNLVAALFADITDRKQAEKISCQTAELDAFRVSLADALRPLTDASEIQAIAARILGEALQATRVIYIEVVSEGEEVIVHRNYTNGVAELSGQYRLEDYGRNLIADHQAGHTQIVTDIPHNPRYTEAEKTRYRELEIAAHIDVPLIKNDQFVALLAVHQSTPRQWTETEVRLVEETAERTWAAVERARAEVALRQNEEMLRLTLVGAHAGTWAWDLTTDQITWSPKTYELHGLDPTVEVPHYQIWYETFLHPDDRDWVSVYIAQIIEQKIPEFQLEYRIVHPHHGIRWLLSRGCLTCNAAEEPVRFSGIKLDITDRKQAEQKIQEQAALLDITSDAISVRDLNHRILYWNQGAVRLYGWQSTEAIGQIAPELLQVNPDQLSEVMPILLAQGEWRGEMQKTTKMGKVVIVESRSTLVRDAAHQPQSILAVDTDITKKKQLEAQFYRAQRLESLGTLASGIAHDLNNVLTPILAISQLLRLQQPDLTAQSQELLQLVETSAKRGTKLIRQILTFSRGTGEERQPVRVSVVVQEVLTIIQQSFPKTIEIRPNLPDPCPWFALANSTYLYQVLMNLCVNARDAMPNGGILSLSVTHNFVDQAVAQANLDAQVGDYVVITIADTGTGILPEIRDRIFDPFFTTKPSGKGTGLGLATVLGIVKEYGGFLQVLSEVNRGTQIKVFLPVTEGTLPPLCAPQTVIK
ncbi:MAG: PAS domain S-box protein [Leptolyngbyaceae cyanobacterium bins.302]|nr:PAS domain S-box protein [Leptolyngbyaceae cyanobacterium bins.302]